MKTIISAVQGLIMQSSGAKQHYNLCTCSLDSSVVQLLFRIFSSSLCHKRYFSLG